MSIRTNEVNNGGILTISGGNMPANTYTNARAIPSRVSGTAAPTVLSNGHAVEVGGDDGCWDTVSGAVVDRSLTTLGTINL